MQEARSITLLCILFICAGCICCIPSPISESNSSFNFTLSQKEVDNIKDGMYFQAADKEGSISYCNRIKGDDVFNLCIGVVRKNPNLCGAIIDNKTMDLCYGKIARSTLNESLCDYITDTDDFFIDGKAADTKRTCYRQVKEMVEEK